MKYIWQKQSRFFIFLFLPVLSVAAKESKQQLWKSHCGNICCRRIQEWSKRRAGGYKSCVWSFRNILISSVHRHLAQAPDERLMTARGRFHLRLIISFTFSSATQLAASVCWCWSIKEDLMFQLTTSAFDRTNSSRKTEDGAQSNPDIRNKYLLLAAG